LKSVVKLLSSIFLFLISIYDNIIFDPINYHFLADYVTKIEVRSKELSKLVKIICGSKVIYIGCF
jgi:hypothetical protein